jgi:hypothetical protein
MNNRSKAIREIGETVQRPFYCDGSLYCWSCYREMGGFGLSKLALQTGL